MFKQRLKKILICFLVTILLFVVVTSSYSRKTSAALFPALALGTGALSALVGAYFATAGIEFSGNNVSSDFLANYVSNWVINNTTVWQDNPYFNDLGEYVGDPDQVSIVQNNDTSATSIIFGKEFAMWLEALKKIFVSSNNLDSVSSNLVNKTGYTFYDGNFVSILPSSYTGSNYDLYSNYDSLLDISAGSSVYFQVREDFGFGAAISSSSDKLIVVVNNNGVYTTYTNNLLSVQGLKFVLRYNNNSNTLVNFSAVYPWGNRFDTFQQYISNISLVDIPLSSISLDGALTDGYEDFEEAVNSDLDSDDEDLVIATGLGVLPDVLNPSDLVDAILEKISIGTLNLTYEGSYEDKATAEEELEGTRPFVPVLPEGWVQVEGLQSFFPFCIPWDIYSVIALLNVPPEAPNFTWRMDLGDNFEPYDIEIDLSDFEMVARVFRIMIVIGFLLFLILKTRDLIRG